MIPAQIYCRWKRRKPLKSSCPETNGFLTFFIKPRLLLSYWFGQGFRNVFTGNVFDSGRKKINRVTGIWEFLTLYVNTGDYYCRRGNGALHWFLVIWLHRHCYVSVGALNLSDRVKLFPRIHSAYDDDTKSLFLQFKVIKSIVIDGPMPPTWVQNVPVQRMQLLSTPHCLLIGQLIFPNHTQFRRNKRVGILLWCAIYLNGAGWLLFDIHKLQNWMWRNWPLNMSFHCAYSGDASYFGTNNDQSIWLTQKIHVNEEWLRWSSISGDW